MYPELPLHNWTNFFELFCFRSKTFSKIFILLIHNLWFKFIYYWAKDCVKSRDMFSISISLKYKGQNNYKTRFGGIVSIIIIILSCFFLELLLRDLITKDRTSKTLTLSWNNLVKDTTTYKVWRFKNSMGFSWLILFVSNSNLYDSEK